VIVTLKVPVQFGSETITELNLREVVKARDLQGTDLQKLTEVDTLLKVLGRLTGQPDPVLRDLDVRDLGVLLQHVNSFLS